MDIFEEYFVNPIRYPDQYAPYNVFNTAAFALVALAVVFLLFRFLQSKKVNIDERFVNTLLPFVLFGGFFRVWEDAKIIPRDGSFFGLPGFLFVTPGIYIVIFVLLALASLAGWFLTKEKDRTFSFVRKSGWAFAAFSFLALVPYFKNLQWGIAALVLAGLAYGAITWGFRQRKITLPPVFHLMIFGQVWDGAATFVGTGFAGYSEQHVVGGLLIGGLGPWAFFAVKILFAYFAAEFLRREEKEDERNFVAFLIALFGLAPGTRDVVRMVAGV